MRRKAARGELPVCLEERLEILVVLAAGKEDEVQACALETLRSWPAAELQGVLRDPVTAVSVLEFVAKNIVPCRRELVGSLLENPSLPPPLREWIERIDALLAEAESSGSSADSLPPPPAAEEENLKREAPQPKYVSVQQQIHSMSVIDKVRAALTGSQEERMILVRDSNRLVARSVLQSPKLTDREVEGYASMKDISEEALRFITLNRKFMRVYAVVRALVNNPRTPVEVGLKLLSQISERDLRQISRNRNVPELIRQSAERALRRKQEAATPKIPGRH